eukprot:9433112-Karenia_brevis.AAC.1
MVAVRTHQIIAALYIWVFCCRLNSLGNVCGERSLPCTLGICRRQCRAVSACGHHAVSEGAGQGFCHHRKPQNCTQCRQNSGQLDGAVKLVYDRRKNQSSTFLGQAYANDCHLRE